MEIPTTEIQVPPVPFSPPTNVLADWGELYASILRRATEIANDPATDLTASLSTQHSHISPRHQQRSASSSTYTGEESGASVADPPLIQGSVTGGSNAFLPPFLAGVQFCLDEVMNSNWYRKAINVTCLGSQFSSADFSSRQRSPKNHNPYSLNKQTLLQQQQQQRSSLSPAGQHLLGPSLSVQTTSSFGVLPNTSSGNLSAAWNGPHPIVVAGGHSSSSWADAASMTPSKGLRMGSSLDIASQRYTGKPPPTEPSPRTSTVTISDPSSGTTAANAPKSIVSPPQPPSLVGQSPHGQAITVSFSASEGGAGGVSDRSAHRTRFPSSGALDVAAISSLAHSSSTFTTTTSGTSMTATSTTYSNVGSHRLSSTSAASTKRSPSITPENSSHLTPRKYSTASHNSSMHRQQSSNAHRMSRGTNTDPVVIIDTQTALQYNIGSSSMTTIAVPSDDAEATAIVTEQVLSSASGSDLQLPGAMSGSVATPRARVPIVIEVPKDVCEQGTQVESVTGIRTSKYVIDRINNRLSARRRMNIVRQELTRQRNKLQAWMGVLFEGKALQESPLTRLGRNRGSGAAASGESEDPIQLAANFLTRLETLSVFFQTANSATAANPNNNASNTTAGANRTTTTTTTSETALQSSDSTASVSFLSKVPTISKESSIATVAGKGLFPPPQSQASFSSMREEDSMHFAKETLTEDAAEFMRITGEVDSQLGGLRLGTGLPAILQVLRHALDTLRQSPNSTVNPLFLCRKCRADGRRGSNTNEMTSNNSLAVNHGLNASNATYLTPSPSTGKALSSSSGGGLSTFESNSFVETPNSLGGTTATTTFATAASLAQSTTTTTTSSSNKSTNNNNSSSGLMARTSLPLSVVGNNVSSSSSSSQPTSPKPTANNNNNNNSAPSRNNGTQQQPQQQQQQRPSPQPGMQLPPDGEVQVTSSARGKLALAGRNAVTPPPTHTLANAGRMQQQQQQQQSQSTTTISTSTSLTIFGGEGSLPSRPLGEPPRNSGRKVTKQ